MQRNIDQERLLVKTFARGLSSDAIAAKLIEADPQNLEASITIVTHACSRLDAYSRLRRGETEMEVGSADTSPPPALQRAVDSLSNTMQHLATKIDKLETRDNQRDNQSTPAQPDRYSRQSQPRSTATRHPRVVNDTRQSTDRYRTPADRLPPTGDRRHNKRPVDYRQPPTTGQRPRQLLCYECGQPGHFAAACPRRVGSRQGNGRTSRY